MDWISGSGWPDTFFFMDFQRFSWIWECFRQDPVEHPRLAMRLRRALPIAKATTLRSLADGIGPRSLRLMLLFRPHQGQHIEKNIYNPILERIWIGDGFGTAKRMDIRFGMAGDVFKGGIGRFRAGLADRMFLYNSGKLCLQKLCV